MNPNNLTNFKNYEQEFLNKYIEDHENYEFVIANKTLLIRYKKMTYSYPFKINRYKNFFSLMISVDNYIKGLKKIR